MMLCAGCALAVVTFFLAGCAGTKQTTSTAPDPTSVVSSSMRLVVGIGRTGVESLGFRLYEVDGGRAGLLYSRDDALWGSLAPGGRHVAYVALEDEVPTLFVEELDGGSRQKIADCSLTQCNPGVLWPPPHPDYAWSPAGDRLVYTTGNDGRFYVRIASLTGEVLADLTPEGSKPTTSFFDPTWSPRGGWITVVEAYWSRPETAYSAAGIDIVPADGSDWRSLLRTIYGRQHLSWPSVKWAPDERQLAVETESDGPATPVYAVFTPSGRRLFATDCARGPLFCPADVAWSPNTRRIAWPEGCELAIATPKLNRIDRIKVRGTGECGNPAWSPDGRSVALVSGREVVGIPTQGGKQKLLFTTPPGGWQVISYGWQTVIG